MSRDNTGRMPAVVVEADEPSTVSGGRRKSAALEGRELVLEADATLTLRCGKASITLTRDGRIVLRGTTVVSHASGVNRIRGGTIKLN